MAKLSKNLTCDSMDLLAGRFKEVLDFYFWKGIPCVRLWPKRYAGIISASQTASYTAFSQIGKMKSLVPPEIRENFKEWAGGTTWIWSDIFTSQCMAYWKATGEVPAVISNPSITYGSGLKHIIMQTNTSAQPWLCRHVPRSLMTTWKEYRGRKELCITPNMAPGVDCVPMRLMYSGGVAFSPPWHSKSRQGQYDVIADYSCSNWRTGAVNFFNGRPEEGPIYNYGLAWQNFSSTTPKFYRVFSTRNYAEYIMPEYYAGIQASRYCGISYDLLASKTLFWPNTAWSFSVFGNHYHYTVPSVPVLLNQAHGVALNFGGRYTINIYNPDHYFMPEYPICETGVTPMYSQVDHTNYQFLIGERWWWEYTFTPPYSRSWWLCYADRQGNLMPIYPVSGKGAKPGIGPG